MDDNNVARENARRDWLAALLLRQPERFMPRLAAALMRWQTLSRGFRRRFTRRVAATAAGAALVLAMAGSPLLVPTARAATITVDEVTCTLIDAITAANTDTATGGCIAGDVGLDTIDLQADVTLTAVAGNYLGFTGLPAVDSEIVIEGNGFTIERDGAAPAFRVLFVGPFGDLTLNDVTISGGSTLARGGGFHLYYGTMAINNSTISYNYAAAGGGGFNESGILSITNTTFKENDAIGGGGLYQDHNGYVPIAVETTITNSVFELNEASLNGGAIYNDVGTLTIIDTIIAGNYADDYGGGIFSYFDVSLVTITGSTLADNEADWGGGIYIKEGVFDLVNSTVSGNSAFAGNGGGIQNTAGHLSLTNTTVSGNYASGYGGGIAQYSGGTSTTITRSIVSGNTAGIGDAHEIDINSGTVTADDFNVFSHDGQTTADAFAGFTPGASDIDAGSDAADIPLTDILDTTLADNGGPTPTHNLVDDSPAVDFAPDADCAAVPTGGIDQRGAARPFDVVGQGNEVTDTCDAGAVEFGSPVPGASIFMSATAAGTTGDGLDFGSEDIIMWDGSDWSMFFDGSAAGLTPTGKWKHNINAFYIDGSDNIIMSFTQNARFVPGITPKVDGMDLVRWNGHSFSLWFDGSDVGLTNKTQEKIDALHILDGSESPVGVSCVAYVLVSTQGPGRVNNGPEQGFRFGGEDVLGFCATNLGADTAGVWTIVLDGSAEGMPRNATDSISFSDDGETMYLTTKGTFNVDAAAGGHSMVYEYDFGSGTFSGPVFDAPAEGLPEKVDGLQME